MVPVSDDLEIRGGGAVAVDTETLRATAARFIAAKCDLDDIAHRFGSLQMMLFAERDVAWEAASSASVLSTRLAETMAAADEIAEMLRSAATVYELVELNAQHNAAFLTGDTAAMARIDALRDELMVHDPGAMERARGFEFERWLMWPSELVRESTQFGYDIGELFGERPSVVGGVTAGGLVLMTAAAMALSGQGRLSRGARLAGGMPDVTIARVSVGTATAPATLAAVAERVPRGDARVRVETYTMADGSKQYAAYVGGTRDAAPWGGADPWDNQANAQLWFGAQSASYAATAEALEAAGAKPGDVVHAFGHSQGGMIVSHLALEGGYDTRTLVTFGSPVEADVGPGTLSVGIRHADDFVPALAAGGHAAPVGAPGSFIVERVVDDAPGTSAHGIAAYTETAALIDASTDPRVDAVRDTFADLGAAVKVDVVEYSATRSAEPVSPSSAGGAGRSRKSS